MESFIHYWDNTIVHNLPSHVYFITLLEQDASTAYLWDKAVQNYTETNQIYHSLAFDGIHLFIYKTAKDLLSY